MTISTLKASASTPVGLSARNDSRPTGHTYPLWASLPVFAIFGWISGEKKRRKRWMRTVVGLRGKGLSPHVDEELVCSQDLHRIVHRTRLDQAQETGQSGRKPLLGFLIAGIILVGILSACGSRLGKAASSTTANPSQPGTPAGNYTVTIIATSGSAQRTATITLTVQ
jgi:hypothetical protein